MRWGLQRRAAAWGEAAAGDIGKGSPGVTEPSGPKAELLFDGMTAGVSQASAVWQGPGGEGGAAVAGRQWGT